MFLSLLFAAGPKRSAMMMTSERDDDGASHRYTNPGIIGIFKFESRAAPLF